MYVMSRRLKPNDKHQFRLFPAVTGNVVRLDVWPLLLHVGACDTIAVHRKMATMVKPSSLLSGHAPGGRGGGRGPGL